MNLLLISNSTNAGQGYLEYCRHSIADFLKGLQVNSVLFVPFAAVTFSYDEYERRVQDKLSPLGIAVTSVHRCANPVQAVAQAQAVVVGGGNTFRLLKAMHDLALVEPVQAKVRAGGPYVGWSAGSNLACPTICTTNDMPIVEPRSFAALNLIPFQINPHYLDAHPDGHAGETREQRIQEFIAANPTRYVAGLREGCMFYLRGNRLELSGSRSLRVFRQGAEAAEYAPGSNLQFLMQG